MSFEVDMTFTLKNINLQMTFEQTLLEYKYVFELYELWNYFHFIWVWSNDLGTQTWPRYCKDLYVYWKWSSRFQPGVDPGFGQGGPQLLRLKVADVAKQSCTSEASNLRLGSRARLRALEAFGFLMLKYAFSHILETLFL